MLGDGSESVRKLTLGIIVTMNKVLTKRQNSFVAEYAKDANATQAAIRAGYSRRSARVTGHRLLTNDALQRRLKVAGQQGLETLMDIAAHGKSESARVQAGTILMDRAWGKTITPIEVSHNTVKICIDLTGTNEEPPEDIRDYLDIETL